MIEKKYYSFEIAKLLKERGFDIRPFHQYYVSSCGKVFGCTGEEMEQETTNRGYKRISLSINGKHERWSVHRLVALLFIPNPEQKLQVNHKDGNKENNDISNLEWCTASENVQHAFDTGLRVVPKGKYLGKNNKLSKPFVCVETGKIYSCQRELWEEFGFDSRSCSHITRACKFGLLDHGFHWRYYEPNELVRLLFEKGYTKYPLSYDGDYWFCYVQMTMKWLRKKGIAVVPILSGVLDNEKFLWDIEITIAKTNETYHQGWIYESYEQACEAAIKYCLENLI